MSYIASALTSRPVTPKSIPSQSLRSSQSFMHDGSTLEEPSELEDNTRPTSLADSTLSPKRRSLNGSRTKTAYRFAHPPPVGIHKQHFHLRPRVLLQLQKISKTARPTPVLEVLPSVTFASRIARRLPRTLKGKVGLGADDLVILNSERYDTDDSEPQGPDDLLEDARWEEREIISVISNVNKEKGERQAKAEIWLNQGQSWIASMLANGSYEFVFRDKHGLRTVARWVRKQAIGARTSNSQNRSRASSEERRFNFSLLNPNSRRHAIIATLDRHSIEVSDRYNSPPMSPDIQGTFTPTASLSEASVGDYMQPRESNPGSDCPTEVDEPLRTLIIVTGLWIALQEGTSTSTNHHGVADRQLVSTSSSTKHQRRSLSLNINNLDSDQALIRGNPSPDKPILGNFNSSSAVPLPLEARRPVRTPPRRSQSTGAAFMRRVTSRNYGTNKISQLSPVGDSEASEPEGSSIDTSFGSGKQRQKREASCIVGLPLRPHTPTYEDSHDSPLSPIVSYGQDPPNATLVSTVTSTRRPSRFGKMFGLKKRTGGAP